LRRKRKRLCSPQGNLANADTMNANHSESPFGDVIYTYTRAQALDSSPACAGQIASRSLSTR